MGKKNRQENLSGQVPPRPDRRVLLVSSDPTDRYGIQRHLEGWNIETCVAGNCIRAFALLVDAAASERPFSTVIVDRPHLEMDPAQIAIAIRSDSEFHTLALIHVGTLSGQEERQQLEDAGYTGFVETPLNKTLLFNILHGDRQMRADAPGVAQFADHYRSERHQPLQIILAGDNLDDQRRMRLLLQDEGHQVFLVQTGAALLDALDAHTFDLAIVDEQLPSISGIEAIKLYRFMHLDQRWIPFLLLLESDESKKVRECHDSNIETWLVKPVRPQRLFDAIQLGLSRQTITQARHPQKPGTTVNAGEVDFTLDQKKLNDLKMLGADRNFLDNLISYFESESLELLKRMGKAVTERDHAGFQNQGLILKDSAGNIGALELFRLGIRASKIDKTAFAENGLLLTKEIERARERSLDSLHKQLARGDNSLSGQE